jgi:hypothetical protein
MGISLKKCKIFINKYTHSKYKLANITEKNEFLETSLRDFKGRFANRLKHEYKLNYEEVVDLLTKAEKTLKKKEISVPISVFENKKLSAFETICKYLKEELKFSYHKIAILLQRDDRTIWASYNNAISKRKAKLIVRKSEIMVPVSIFKNRKLSVLESLVNYLKENFKLRFSEIAALLNKDQRNIWTVYNRAKKKND